MVEVQLSINDLMYNGIKLQIHSVDRRHSYDALSPVWSHHLGAVGRLFRSQMGFGLQLLLSGVYTGCIMLLPKFRSFLCCQSSLWYWLRRSFRMSSRLFYQKSPEQGG